MSELVKLRVNSTRAHYKNYSVTLPMDIARALLDKYGADVFFRVTLGDTEPSITFTVDELSSQHRSHLGFLTT